MSTRNFTTCSYCEIEPKDTTDTRVGLPETKNLARIKNLTPRDAEGLGNLEKQQIGHRDFVNSKSFSQKACNWPYHRGHSGTQNFSVKEFQRGRGSQKFLGCHYVIRLVSGLSGVKSLVTFTRRRP